MRKPKDFRLSLHFLSLYFRFQRYMPFPVNNSVPRQIIFLRRRTQHPYYLASTTRITSIRCYLAVDSNFSFRYVLDNIFHLLENRILFYHIHHLGTYVTFFHCFLRILLLTLSHLAQCMDTCKPKAIVAFFW